MRTRYNTAMWVKRRMPRANTMNRLLPAVLVLFSPLTAYAALNPEADKKYQLEVVLHCGTHNWLGEQFRNDLRSDLAGILQDALGGMADVTVIDVRKVPVAEWKPLWKEIEARGFAALDSSQELTGVKSHFLRIDFVNGQYELQTRQVDGYTGIAGVARSERTADRALVTRVAGKMIAEEFGLLGTIEGTGERVTVRFKGGAINPSLVRLANKGDVFAVVAVYQQQQGDERIERGQRIPDTVIHLLSEPKNGAASAELVFRPKVGQSNPLQSLAGVQGFRCIKLGTTVGPVRLRLVDDRGQPHTRGLQVRLHANRFQTTADPAPDEEALAPDPRSGLFISKNNYEQMAFARVVTGSVQLTRFPVEIHADRVVTIQVSLDAKKEQAGQLQLQANEMQRNYSESQFVVSSRYREGSTLIGQSKYEEALKASMATRAGLEEDIKRLGSQFDQLKQAVGANPISLKNSEILANSLNDYRTKLNIRIGQLEDTIKEANDPARLAQQKKLLDLNNKSLAQFESNDYDGAIATCKQILKEFGEQKVARDHLEQWERGWALKGEAHQQAREFVYRDFPTIKSSADFDAKLPTARQKMQVLIGVKDEYTLLKLRNTLPDVAKALREEITAAKQDADDADKLAKLKKTVEDFDKFSQEVDAAVQGKK